MPKASFFLMRQAMKRLDKTRPYGEIHGGPNLFYEQDESYFDAKGRECSLDSMNAPLAPDEDEPVLVPSDAAIIDYRAMQVVALKVLVESYGEVYQNKASAIAFLEGQANENHASLD